VKAVILAAGEGQRLGRGVPKPLVNILGLTLLERSVFTLREAGVEEIIVVSGFKGHLLASLVAERGLEVKVIENGDYKGGSATSILAAKDHVGDRFLVVTGDHLFEPSAIKGLSNARGSFVAAIDSTARHVDPTEATKVLFSNGRVERIGKDLTEFNGLDAGAFICSQEVFPVIERCVDEGRGAWNDVKREWIDSSAREMRAFDLKGAFWLDVDTEEDLKRARQLLLQRLTKARDGIISRHLNRKLSCPLTSLLVNTKLTPNQISLLAFVIGIISGALFSFGSYPLVAIGGLMAQITSVIDGCDGEVARLKHATSKYGAWFDAVLDRVADAVIITGMSYGLVSATGQPLVWILGTVALTASLLISYSEARYESAFGRKMPSSGRAVPAKRDARLFLVMLGGLLNQVLLTLIVLGFLGTSEVARRLWTSYRATRRPSRKGDSVLQRHKGKSVARVPAPQVLSSENAGAPNREFKDGMIGN